MFAKEIGEENNKVNAEVVKVNVEVAKCGEIMRDGSILQKICEEDSTAAIPWVQQEEANFEAPVGLGSCLTKCSTTLGCFTWLTSVWNSTKMGR